LQQLWKRKTPFFFSFFLVGLFLWQQQR
jgi:hypothetical protein